MKRRRVKYVVAGYGICSKKFIEYNEPLELESIGNDDVAVCFAEVHLPRSHLRTPADREVTHGGRAE